MQTAAIILSIVVSAETLYICFLRYLVRLASALIRNKKIEFSEEEMKNAVKQSMKLYQWAKRQDEKAFWKAYQDTKK